MKRTWIQLSVVLLLVLYTVYGAEAATPPAEPVNSSPAGGSANVPLMTRLEISVTFPSPDGGTHQSTDWTISSDATFGVDKVLFSSTGDAVNKTSLTIPLGILRPSTTYYWRAAVTDSQNQTSPPSAATSFTTITMMMDPTGVVPDSCAVKQNGSYVTDVSMGSMMGNSSMGNMMGGGSMMSGSMGNMSNRMMNDFSAINAGMSTDMSRPGMMIVKSNGGAGNDILGLATPAGVRIENLTTASLSDASFGGRTPAGVTCPYGVMGFRASNVTPGTPVTFTMYMPADLPADAAWYKYDPMRGWLKVDATGVHDQSGTLLSRQTTFTVSSGKGMLTIMDDDQYADRSREVVGGKAVIVDPGTVGLSSSAPVPANGSDSGGGGGGGGCFIATAAFGSYLDPHVMVLRHFRDTFLLTNRVGRLFVDFYYSASPPLANLIEDHGVLKSLVRITLLPVIAMVSLILEIGTMWFLILALLSLLCLIMLGRRALKAPSHSA